MENDFELEPGCEETPELREQELRQDMLQESEEFLEPEEKPVFDFKYTLSEQEYIDFNLMLFERNMAKSKRKMRIFGILEIIIAALMFSLFFNLESTSLLIKIMTVVLFLFGIFSLAYYSYIFPSQLKKSVRKTYQESENLKGEFHIRLYETFVRDTYEAVSYTHLGRRHSVYRRKREHAGRVLPYLQYPLPRWQADCPDFRPAAQGDQNSGRPSAHPL